MAARPKRIGNWTPDGKADRAAERREFLETTPGQRVEQAIELSSSYQGLAAGDRLDQQKDAAERTI